MKTKKTKTLDEWSLYLLRCADGTLYTGITKNLEKRIQQHNQGKASKYTRTRLPVKLVYQELCSSHGGALRRECEIKTYEKKRKEALVKATSEHLNQVSVGLPREGVDPGFSRPAGSPPSRGRQLIRVFRGVLNS